MSDLITVYLPTKDRVEFLAKAVASVQSQSYSNFELIIVDDGSTDDTPSFLRFASQSDKRLRHIRNPVPHGPSKARNIAIRLGQGKYVTGLDDDDQFAINRLANFIDLWRQLEFQKVRTSFVFSGLKYINDGKGTVPAEANRTVTFQDLFKENKVGNQIFCLRETILDAGLFDETLPAWEDLDLFLRMLRQFGAAYMCEEATYICDSSPVRNRISRNEARVRQGCAVMLEKYNELPPSDLRNLFIQMFSDFHGIRPVLSDYKKLFSIGVDPSSLFTMLKAHLKRTVGR